jgi:hypothetical protein
MVVRLLTAAALLGTAACTSVKPVLNAREFIPANRPARVWVVNTQNESYVLTAPRVEGDNIVGMLLNSGEEMSIPIAKAQVVEARQRDQKKTLIMGVVLGSVVGGVVFLAASSGNSDPDPQNYNNGEQP